MLKAFDEVCGKTKGRGDQGDTWWWNKEMCKSGTEVSKARYKNMKNRAKKVVAKAMKEGAEQELSEDRNKVFKLVK